MAASESWTVLWPEAALRPRWAIPAQRPPVQVSAMQVEAMQPAATQQQVEEELGLCRGTAASPGLRWFAL